MLNPPVTDTAPLRWRRVFPGAAPQARAARRFVACLLDGRPGLDEVLLTVDELVVNALRHTKSGLGGGAFAVDVRCTEVWCTDVWRADGRIAIAVTDQGGPDEPVARDADPLAESGRGLRTVSLLAAGWGWYGNESGRTVTAEFSYAGTDRMDPVRPA